MTMPPIQDIPSLKARVASVALCKDPTCPHKLSTHLVVKNVEVPLEEDQATAISYTWGEFNRQKVFIGHSDNEETQPITLELGEEWEVQEVIERLAELSANGPIWLDQLCIVQRDEAIRECLAKIPTIFHTFQVIVLMPGHPCKCLHEFVSQVKLLPTPESKVVRLQAFYQCLENYDRCLNFIGSSSWFRRLWTRQELMYSRSVRCVWASKIIPPCVPRNEIDTLDVHISRYSALKRQQFIDQGIPSPIASHKLDIHLFSTQAYASAEIRAYLFDSGTADHGESLPSYLYEFLDGEILKQTNRTGTIPTRSLGQLQTDLTLISASFAMDLVTRTSTHLQDYVLAVFPEWPLYVVPEEPKTHEMHCLMQDALNQLHAKEHLTLLTTAPQGLFDETSRGSAVWYPDHYHKILQSVKPPSEINLRDIYGPIFGLSLVIVILDSATPIVFSHPEPPISTSAKDFDTYMTELVNKHGEGEAKLIIIKQMRSVIQKWTREFFDAFGDPMVSFYPADSGEISQELKAQSVLRYWLELKLVGQDDNAERFAVQWGRLFDKDSWNLEDIKKVLYTLMALALRLNEEICQKSGVRIVVGRGDSRLMRLGFYCGNIDLSSLGSEAEGRHEIRTVRMDISRSGPPSEQSPLLYEVIQGDQPKILGEEGFFEQPYYKVFAVWIALQGLTQGTQEYNAEAWDPRSEDSVDAWLV